MWKMTAHKRIRTPSSCHVICRRQCGYDILLGEEVEDLIRVRSRTAEDVLSERFGGRQSLRCLWVRIANGFK